MAKADFITPFPADVDRDAFGHWLSGFTDGEGTFFLGTYRARSSDKRNPTIYANHRSRFIINLRADDSEALSLVQRYWQCGSFYKNTHPRSRTNPGTYFSVDRWQDLIEVVIPHFNQFPLRAKKANDFIIWEEATQIVGAVLGRPRKGRGPGLAGSASRWTESEKEHFIHLRDKLRGQRKFKDKTLLRMPAKPYPKEEQNMLFL